VKLDEVTTLSTREERIDYCNHVLAKLGRCYWGDIPEYYLSWMLVLELEQTLINKWGEGKWEPTRLELLRLHHIDETVFKPLGFE
jgi:hypothetical protein